jgi:hypothetical protein
MMHAGCAQGQVPFALRYPFLASDADRRAYLDFAFKVLLYRPPSSLPAPPAPGSNRAAQQALGPAAAAPAPQPPPPPPLPAGLSVADAKRVEGKAPPTGKRAS